MKKEKKSSVKIKASLKVEFKTFAMISAIIFALLFVLRIYQVFCLTEPSTGFFTTHSNITVPLFYALSIGGTLFAVIGAYLTPSGTAGMKEKKDIPLAAASLLLSVFLALDGVKKIGGAFNIIPGQSVNYIEIAVPVMALISAAVMAVNGISFIVGKNVIGKIKILALSPALWAFFTTINYFKITVSYLKVSQLMLIIFADAFFMLFMLEYARYVSGIGIKEATWSLYATGIVSSSLLLISEIPNLISALFVQSKVIVNCEFNAVNLIAGIFAVLVMINVSKNTEKAEK